MKYEIRQSSNLLASFFPRRFSTSCGFLPFHCFHFCHDSPQVFDYLYKVQTINVHKYYGAIRFSLSVALIKHVDRSAFSCIVIKRHFLCLWPDIFMATQGNVTKGLKSARETRRQFIENRSIINFNFRQEKLVFFKHLATFLTPSAPQ